MTIDLDPKTSKWKNEVGNFLVRGLFFETCNGDFSRVQYTLKNYDHKGYPSLYRLYMEVGDPTEYRFANECLGGWQHWEEIKDAAFFKEYIELWRRELDIRLKSEAFIAIKNKAKAKEDKDAFAASKYLVESLEKLKGTHEKKHGRGRPSKDEIKRTALEIALNGEDIENEYGRVIELRGKA